MLANHCSGFLVPCLYGSLSVLLCVFSFGTGSLYIAFSVLGLTVIDQVSHRLTQTHLRLPSKCWGLRHVLPCLAVIHFLEDIWSHTSSDTHSAHDSELLLSALCLVQKQLPHYLLRLLAELDKGHTCRMPPAPICLFSCCGVIRLACQQEVISFIASFLSRSLW